MAGGLHHIQLTADHAGWRVDRAVTDVVGTLSRERIKKLISEGALEGENGPLRDPATKMKGGESFTLTVPEPRPHHAAPQDIPLEIIAVDEI